MISKGKYIVLALVLLICSASCKKKGDDVLPVITIILPVENTWYDVLDTIIISATASDETSLESISIGLVDENLIPVLNVLQLNPNNNSVSFTEEYVVYDKYMEGGPYYIRIRASDGENIKNQYQRINIEGLQRKFEYIVALSAMNMIDLKVTRIDLNSNVDHIYSLYGDYSASAASSRYKYLYVAGCKTGDMNVVDLVSPGIVWKIDCIINQPFPYFNHIYLNDEDLYVSYYNGNIKGSNLQGPVFFNATVPTNLTPVKLFIHNEYILFEQVSKIGQDRSIAVHYLQSGTFKQVKQANLEIIDMFSKDNNEVFVFANDGNQGTIKVYNIPQNGLSQPQSFPNERITSVAQVNSTEYLIAGENGVYLYQSITNSLVPFITNVSPSKIRYEDISGNIVLTEDKQIKVYHFSYNLPITAPDNTIALPDSIYNIHLVYNK